MLVLKRKIGESIIIGNDIEIVILEQEGDAVRVGIRAPKNVNVYRKEIFEEISKANKGALQSPNLNDLLNQYRKLEENDEK